MTSRSIPAIRLLRDDFVRAIAEEASGERVLEHFRQSLRHQGFAPSMGYNAILEQAACHLREWGYESVEQPEMPSDGESYAWAFRTEPAWDVQHAALSLVEPVAKRLTSFSEKPTCLARFSRSVHLETTLVHVGEGVRDADYDGIDVAGKLVMAWGTPVVVARQAIGARGAAGLIWYRIEGKAHLPDATQLVYTVPWQLDDGSQFPFAFSISYSNAMLLDDLLKSGQAVVLRADIESRVYPSQLRVATGILRGRGEPCQEIWILGHCDHRNTGGINNLTGYGCSLETARVMADLIRSGRLTPPKRTIRFFFGSEHNGPILYFHQYPEVTRRIAGAIVLDMVGMDRRKTGANLSLLRTPHSAPHYINDVAQYFLEYVNSHNQVDIRNGNILTVDGDRSGFSRPILAPTGSRDSFAGAIAEFWGPSDQEDLVDGSVGVPAVLLSEWPDPFFHTELDSIDKADPTQLRRVVTLTGSLAYYLSMAGPDDLPALAINALGKARARAGKALTSAATALTKSTPRNLVSAWRDARLKLTHTYDLERAAILSLQTLCEFEEPVPAVAVAVRALSAEEKYAEVSLVELTRSRCRETGIDEAVLDEPPPEEPPYAAWVPERVTELRGPINLHRPQYGQMWLQERVGNRDFLSLGLLHAGQYHPWEALNLADGRRTLLEIRNALSAEYGPVRLDHVYEYFALLVDAGAVRWRIVDPSMRTPERG